ncbi:hypothetical protein [Leifsonia sp. 21MFCrub1.1]|nr:hypothetical protein [Leifsonia sp. 21MFCrub1.1]SEA75255.1 hypothetical protein SAMN04515680_1414 [Leifsonia sp. 21MFCrub1.1]
MVITKDEVIAPDGVTFVPTYVPTIEETIKASGGHQQMMCEAAPEFEG